MGVSHAVTGVLIGNGTTSEFTGHIRGIITGINTSSDGNDSNDVKVISRVSTIGSVTDVDYAKSDKTRSFQASDTLIFNNSSGVGTTGYSTLVQS